MPKEQIWKVCNNYQPNSRPLIVVQPLVKRGCELMHKSRKSRFPVTAILLRVGEKSIWLFEES